MRGTLGACLSHVWEVQDLIVNEKILEEAGIAAYIASYYGVQFIFAAGDDFYKKEVKECAR
jgi:D-aminopeptidase